MTIGITCSLVEGSNIIIGRQQGRRDKLVGLLDQLF
jgi:hypothetical protein